MDPQANNEVVPATAAPTAENESVNEWQEMSEELDNPSTGGVSQEAAGAGTEPDPVEPVVTEPVVAPTPTEPVVPEVVAPVVTETPEQQQARYNEYITQRTGELEAEYAITDDDAALLLTEPEKVLPRMAANMQLKLEQQMQAMVNQAIATHVPGVMRHLVQSDVRETKAKDEFFTRWPELKGKDEAVLNVGKMFRAANPRATPQEAVEKIGQIVMVSLGLGSPTTAGQSSAAVTPPSPAGRGGARPAAPNSGKVEDNEWAAMSKEFDN